MMASASWTSLLWFVAIVAMIPAALWLLKRSPITGAAAQGVMRHVATLPLAPNQRIVTIEVGAGEGRRWLVLGVTPQQITTLYSVPPQGDVPLAGQPSPPFGQLLSNLRRGDGR
jgi:flagellar protein FliO/FliZ